MPLQYKVKAAYLISFNITMSVFIIASLFYFVMASHYAVVSSTKQAVNMKISNMAEQLTEIVISSQEYDRYIFQNFIHLSMIDG